VDQGVVPLGALGVLPAGVRLAGAFRLGQGRSIVAGGGRRLGQAGAVGRDALLDGLGQVLPQVEPVGDLKRVRRPGTGSVRVGPRAVLQITSTPGWAASQSASGWASRPSMRSSGAPVSMSISSVP
jgi:hypothetical protein